MSTNHAFDAKYPATPKELVFLLNKAASRINSRGEEKPMQPVMIWGAPGLGKTDIVGQIAKMRESRLVALHLPQYDPTDVKGIPIRQEDGTVRWVPSAYMSQQHRVKTLENTKVSVKFSYAVSLAVYLFDENGTEVFRFNDAVMPDTDDVGVGSCTITQSGDDWTVELENMPDTKCSMTVVDKTVIFLDELSGADPTTQKAALQLVLDRRVGDYEVPHSVPLLAAGNRESDGAYVQAFNHPLANRLIHMTLVPSVSDWIDWAWEKRKRPEVIGFVKWLGREALYGYEPSALNNGNYGFNTPRSIAMLADQYEELDYYKSAFKDTGMSDGDITASAKKLRTIDHVGTIGERAASAFSGYLEVMHDMPAPDDIADGKATQLGNVERSQSFGLLYALVYKLEERFVENYNADLPAKEQSSRWTNARDNILDFITNNFENEAGAWVNAIVFQKTDIKATAMRGEAFLRFAKKFVDTASRV